MKICISASHTNVGKTHLSSLLCSTLNYDYFKLVQAGEDRDSKIVESYCEFTQSKSIIHLDGVFLKTPASPHIGKKLENNDYRGLEIPLPKSQKLVIETAGGIYTPLDERHTMLDFMQHHSLPTLLVGRYYLGSINHILLSIEAIKNRQIKLLGVVLTGEKNEDFDRFITNYCGVKLLHLRDFNQNNFYMAREDFLPQLREIGIS